MHGFDDEIIELFSNGIVSPYYFYNVQNISTRLENNDFSPDKMKQKEK